jgi:hypothetical protein
MSKKSHRVKVAGVAVRVCFNDHGRPLAAHAGIERPGDLDHERVVDLAVTRALDAVSGTAKRKRDSVTAATVSAEKRAKASAEHWTNEWFERAYAEHSDYRRTKLARHARQLAAAGGIELAKRDEITEGRAQQFLDRQNQPPAITRNRG